MRGSSENEPEIEQNTNIDNPNIDIPESFDPSLRFEELQVQSQSKIDGPKEELGSFRQFGITRYTNCKCELEYMYDSYFMK